MSAALTAEDLWPRVQKLARDEQVRLAKLALMAAAERGPSANADASREADALTAADELGHDEAI